ncbi:FIG00638839: hypothetical protein [Klebsiella pneumoniae IS22]|nr:FIG00638839: hypothetical protein [Klebsiella pneumoniae IS22]
MVPCNSLFFEYPSWGAFIVFALPPGVGLKYKADKNKNTIAQAMVFNRH